MTAGESGGQQKPKAVVNLREQLGNHQHPKQRRKGELDGLSQHFVGEIGANPLYLGLEFGLGEGEAPHAHGRKDQDDQHAGIAANGAGERQHVQPLVPQSQGDKTGNHAGRHKKFLNQRHLGPD